MSTCLLSISIYFDLNAWSFTVKHTIWMRDFAKGTLRLGDCHCTMYTFSKVRHTLVYVDLLKDLRVDAGVLTFMCACALFFHWVMFADTLFTWLAKCKGSGCWADWVAFGAIAATALPSTGVCSWPHRHPSRKSAADGRRFRSRELRGSGRLDRRTWLRCCTWYTDTIARFVLGAMHSTLRLFNDCTTSGLCFFPCHAQNWYRRIN